MLIVCIVAGDAEQIIAAKRESGDSVRPKRCLVVGKNLVVARCQPGNEWIAGVMDIDNGYIPLFQEVR